MPLKYIAILICDFCDKQSEPNQNIDNWLHIRYDPNLHHEEFPIRVLCPECFKKTRESIIIYDNRK